MVALTAIKASNATLPTRLTAVFVGGTSGIGLYTLLALARHCANPTIYFIGRSQTAADRILIDLRTLNPKGTYKFIPSDVALIKNVDAVCEQIKVREKHVNILVQSQGVMSVGQETSEGMHATASLVLHSRMRFQLNLLPLLQAAPGLKRVVSIFTGTKEGPITATELQMRTLKNPLKARGQAASAVTLLLEEAQRRAKDVSFVHTYPGFVSTGIGRDFGIVAKVLSKAVETVVGPWLLVPNEESGERNLWLATSGRFAAAGGENEVDAAVGTNGKVGSGVYTVDEKGESGGEAVLKVLRELREQKKDEWCWEEVRKELLRITEKESL
ncbi:uncharacterized protein N0V89_001976 [Didymosphaeria variabile]|uniref:NAD(P)-binding protein n=1 Tax=Didymosphaeria variabile TaxID=1932322 RepID=A0A9W8XRN9_9PLEO|nr:uncharacterized protein N0V89_001976 [Didymosphaeria variabile]KAJ4357401.1 hypothetical protein N0V89_001976 [Didymosphaeria variabile]